MGRSGRGCTDVHPGDVGVYGIVDVLCDMLDLFLLHKRHVIHEDRVRGSLLLTITCQLRSMDNTKIFSRVHVLIKPLQHFTRTGNTTTFPIHQHGIHLYPIFST